MRVTTAFNKMLSIPSATVASVEFTPEGVLVGLRRRRGRPRCPCGWRATGAYDSSVRRWRHLDLGASKLLLQAQIRRLDCRRCGRVRTEAVPWARPRARHSRDFEDVVAWLAQHTDKTTITRLLRTSWETVAGIVTRVVAEQIDEDRLSGSSADRGRRGQLPQGTPVPDRGRRPRPGRPGGLGRPGQERGHPGGLLRPAGRGGLRSTTSRQHGSGSRVQEGHRHQGRAGPSVRGPLPHCCSGERRHRQGPQVGLEPRTQQGTTRSRTGRPETPRPTAYRQSATCARPGPLGQAHPLGAAQGPRHPQALTAGGAAPTAPQRLGALPLLAAQGRPARPLPTARPRRRRRPTSTGGWTGPAAAASPPSSPSPRPSAATATGSSTPSSSDSATANSRA